MNLKLERIKNGMTQKQLREKTGVSLNTIVAIEKGNIDNVTVKTLKKIAAALNTTVEKLFFYEED